MNDSAMGPVLLFDDGISRSRRHDEWINLIGMVVDVRKDGEFVRRGVVEDATLDGSHVWIAGEGITGRALFDKGSGYQVWIHPLHIQRRASLVHGDPTNQLPTS
ncbi:hypothetical protein ACHMXB_21730 (plasmid) [Arthrobacter sp. UC242_113]|uniref:hypothetical protein n=1 Tax=Arthrobacter sp. UC242_113 TaxID=3374550 RepID=UPI003757C418